MAHEAIRRQSCLRDSPCRAGFDRLEPLSTLPQLFSLLGKELIPLGLRGHGSGQPFRRLDELTLYFPERFLSGGSSLERGGETCLQNCTVQIGRTFHISDVIARSVHEHDPTVPATAGSEWRLSCSA